MAEKIIQMIDAAKEVLYPVIISDNIPDSSIDAVKIKDNNVGENKLDTDVVSKIDRNKSIMSSLLQALGKDREHFIDPFVKAGIIPIPFKDPEVKRILVENYDKDGDGEISYEEAHAVKNDWQGFPLYLFTDNSGKGNTTITSFKEMRFFDSITSVGNGGDVAKAFCGCSNLKEIEFPDGITMIGNNTFYKTSLEKVDVPASVKTIQKCFNMCSNLKEVTLHEGLETIGNETFMEDNKLQKCDLPSTVKTIGSMVFWRCYDLEMDELPEGLTSLGGEFL